MEVTARECKWSKDYEGLGLFCDKKGEKISAINADKPCPFCREGEKQELGVVRRSRRSKYNSLNKCFLACGAPKEYCYADNPKLKKKGGHRCESGSIYRHPDGTAKRKWELLGELKRFYEETIREIHPDVNPYSERLYFDEESKEVNAAYQQGVRLINYRFG